MTRRGVRPTLAAVFLLLVVGAGVALWFSQQRTAGARAATREFDLAAQRTQAAVADLRAALPAAVAAGQNADQWLARAATALQTARDGVASLKQRSADGSVLNDLDAASAALDGLASVHAEAARLVRGDLRTQAAALILGEGHQLALSVQERIEGARIGEAGRLDTDLAMLRAYEVVGLGALGAIGLIVIGLLLPQPDRAASAEAAAMAPPMAPEPSVDPAARDEAGRPAMATSSSDGAPRHESDAAATAVAATAGFAEGAAASSPLADDLPGADMTLPPRDRRKAPELRAAADLCTDFARLLDAQELPGLLARAARLLDATGFIVWLADADGLHLRASLAHGYPASALARLPAIPRDADNATAAAYRRREMEIVSTNGMSPGAIVVPLLGPSGCVGVMAAEVRHGREASESERALARIVAAQLSTLVSAGVQQADGAATTTPAAAEAQRAAG